jgi:hypothetical protein
MRTIQQQLKQWVKVNKIRMDKHKKERKPKRKQEKFTEWELKELMGMNRPVYRRSKGGAFRQI